MKTCNVSAPRLSIGCATLMILVLVGTALADPANTKVANRLDHKSAATVDFAKVLGIDSPSLLCLGAKIEEARSAPDPFALAVCAKELAAMETASGKTASIKSEDLLKEAVEMAKVRDQPEELKSIAALLGDSGKELAEQAEKTEKALAADAANAPGDKGRGITGSLIVINHTPKRLYIAINFQAVGIVGPMSEASFSIPRIGIGGQLDMTVLRARTSDWTGSWQDIVPYPTENYTWEIPGDPSAGQ
jgi:hypothetical protein